MRLIDADALSQNVIALGKTGDSYDPEVLNFRIGYNSALLAVKKLIANAPTLDVQPVRRGEWRVTEIVGYDGVNAVYAAPCSACGEFSKEAHLFCPNCGADMRKEAHHEPED